MNKSGNLMVPTARLELARPRSLPPQDSVSTNSTTSAKGMRPDRYCLLLRDVSRFRTGILARRLCRRCRLSLRRRRNTHALKPAGGRFVLLQSEICQTHTGQEDVACQYRSTPAQDVG